MQLESYTDHKNSDPHTSQDGRRADLDACQSEQRHAQNKRPPLPANPRSADLYVYKSKAKMLNRVPTYQPAAGLNLSDNDDVSTRVSSKSQVQRNYLHQKKNSANLDYCMPTHDS